MPAQQRATIARELIGQINRWLVDATTYANPDGLVFNGFMRAAAKLTGPDPYQASLARAMAYHLTGNVTEAMRWVKNARNWPNDTESWETELVILSNLGYFKKCAELVESWSSSIQVIQCWLNVGLLSGAFEHVARAFTGTPVADTLEGRQAIELAERCVMSLQYAEVPENHVREVIDLAGEVMRRHELFFSEELPLIRTYHDGMLYQLRVPVDAQTSVEMTDEVLVQMIERDLDRPGFCFAFIPS